MAKRWQRRKDTRPPEILDAALAVFAQKGFAATRLDDVAAKVGPLWEAMGHYALGCAHLLAANWSEAVTALEQPREIIRRMTANRPLLALR